MKPSKTLTSAIENTGPLRNMSNVRAMLLNSMAALARKEMSATDAEAISKLSDSVCNTINTEIRLAIVNEQLQQKSKQLVETVRLGRTLIGEFTVEDEAENQ